MSGEKEFRDRIARQARVIRIQRLQKISEYEEENKDKESKEKEAFKYKPSIDGIRKTIDDFQNKKQTKDEQEER